MGDTEKIGRHREDWERETEIENGEGRPIEWEQEYDGGISDRHKE